MSLLEVVFLDFVSKRVPADLEQLGGPGFVTVRILERLLQKVLFDLLETGALGWQMNQRIARRTRHGTHWAAIGNANGQMSHVDAVLVDQDHGALNCVFEFPDVAWPGI